MTLRWMALWAGAAVVAAAVVPAASAAVAGATLAAKIPAAARQAAVAAGLAAAATPVDATPAAATGATPVTIDALPTAGRQSNGAVTVTLAEWQAFAWSLHASFVDAEAAAGGGPLMWNLGAAMARVWAAPSYAPGGGDVSFTPAQWEDLGEFVGHFLATGSVSRTTGRSLRCRHQADACQSWWNHSGCTSRRYCCCPAYCELVYEQFGALRIASRAGGTHACCVGAFC
ncbi:hypothetical protein BU14_0298s0012 [Porphyra umbilicalis]|uniref:Pherophorin domain-containing protein n=1 Tax=Porphyra umbilicalis TaxID=2786 RepID=A0A1X6P073_PORUM|nr:hypothetical protein BU14_0298s0012 [Porphyra umbilicalis]|eukprot:OSX74268.1 hypothetical protein BU14_0298s0012 [Porphyra umbilicalis]